MTAISPIHMRRSFALHAFGAYDPTAQWKGETLVKTFSTAEGVCTATLWADAEGLHVSADGANVESIVQQFMGLGPSDDGYVAFVPGDDRMRSLKQGLPGLRLVRVPWLFDIACSAVLQQRVRAADAMRDWRRVAERFGRRSANGQVALPTPAQFAEVPLHDLIGLGLDPKRARTLLGLANGCRFRPLRPHLTWAQLRARLSQIAGIGPWTTEMILGFGAGDPDAVPIGDVYLPHLVTYALSGVERGSDEIMLALLEPYRPYRFRAIRLLYNSKIAVPGWPAR